MSARIKYHLDEHIDPDIAKALLRHGIDVTTTLDAGLRGGTDRQHWQYARQSGRVIVTHDPDFLRLAKQNVQHCGIVFCPMGSMSIGTIVRRLILFWELLDPKEVAGRVEYL